jgi:hypothetical protein
MNLARRSNVAARDSSGRGNFCWSAVCLLPLPAACRKQKMVI